MARYNYKCVNTDCKSYDKIVEVTKPMMESSRVEPCEVCGEELQRDYKGAGIMTADGSKS